MFSAVRITLLLTEINSSWIVLCKEGWAEILASKYSKWEKNGLTAGLGDQSCPTDWTMLDFLCGDRLCSDTKYPAHLAFLSGIPVQPICCQRANILVPFASENQPSCCWIGRNHLAALEVTGASCHTDSQSASRCLEWKSAPSPSAGSEGSNCSLTHHALLPLLFPKKEILFHWQWGAKDLT